MRLILPLLTLCATLLLAACGQKGDLYLPDSSEQRAQASATVAQ